jgi:RNA polymerase sigma factor (sigma-70 family)
MVESNRAALLNLLLAGYDDLKSRLTRRLGSAELAGEALQDTFLRLSDAPEMGPIKSPQAYLFRVAMSVAANRRRLENRRMTQSEIEAFVNFADDAPDPARIIEARSEIEALKRAMMELPARRRQILIAACIDETPYYNIARRFGVTVRTIQVELKQALTHCALRLDRNFGKRVSPRSRQICLSEEGPLDAVSAATQKLADS